MDLAFKVYVNDRLVAKKTFDQEIIKIGRLSSAHLKLDDERVSRIHAVIEKSPEGEVHIIDMGSAEGTFVNGDRVNKSALNPGDEIRLGSTRIVFQSGEEQTNPKAKAPVIQPEKPSQPASAPSSANDSVDDMFPDEATVATSLPVGAIMSFEAEKETRPEKTAQKPKPAPAVKKDPQATPTDKEVEGSSPPLVSIPAASASTTAGSMNALRVALPPSATLGELNDDETVSPQNWAIEVRKLWGDTALDVQYFSPEDKKVVVGEDDKAQFFMPADLLPANSYSIARVVGSEAVISFNRNAKGFLRMPDGSLTELTEMAKGPSVGQDPEYPDCKIFSLPEGAIATVSYGNISLRFKYVSKPAGYLSKLADMIDYTFLNTILLVMFIYAATVATFHLRPKPVITDEESLHKVPDRYVQFILTRPKPAKKDLVFLEKLKSDIDAQSSDSAPRYKGKEGKMGLKGAPDTGKRSAVRAIKPDDREVVGNRGLLGALGAGGPSGLSTVMGGSGLGGELNGAIGNMFGSAPGNSGGFGGLGLKGTGSGGGGVGNTIGVGRLGTRGRGGGSFGYGRGVAKVRRRAERDIDISVGRPVIMGSLSMEIIRRVIRSHRDQIKYCYNKELTRHPNLTGKVSIKFTISPKGYVSQATVSQTTLNNASVERCIASKIKTWKFPEPKGGGIVIVNYPFILKSN
jgi:pSer/pThr/pTyr-binding forkhead associated (FHA) protein